MNPHPTDKNKKVFPLYYQTSDLNGNMNSNLFEDLIIFSNILYYFMPPRSGAASESKIKEVFWHLSKGKKTKR